jgi:aminomethyltransferase
VSTPANTTLRRTALFDRHVARGRREAGPVRRLGDAVQYAGIREEHMAVRENVGVFDVSHMGQIETRGPEALELLQRLLSNDVAAIPRAALSTACCAARTAACSTTCSPTAWRRRDS